jgi:hypothetical protein
MHMPRLFASTAVTLTLLAMSAPVHADSTLLSNLDQPPSLASKQTFYGQSFITGNVNETLRGATMPLDPSDAPSKSITLEVEARTSSGTVGATLFSDFSSSYDPTTHLVAFTADSSYVLKSGTGYWLVLSDPGRGVEWQFTTSNTIQAQDGYALPTHNTAFISTGDHASGNATYYQLSDGPQMFELTATSVSAVPEPSTASMAAFGAVAFTAYGWYRRRRDQLRQAAA